MDEAATLAKLLVDAEEMALQRGKREVRGAEVSPAQLALLDLPEGGVQFVDLDRAEQVEPVVRGSKLVTCPGAWMAGHLLGCLHAGLQRAFDRGRARSRNAAMAGRVVNVNLPKGVASTRTGSSNWVAVA